jgi:signal transduction histidine kinase
MLELAADAPGLPEEIASYVSEARASAARLASLVNDLLDIARIESGRLAVEVTAVPLQELAASVLDELRPIADAKHHLVERELALPTAVVEADVQLLRQAITNLMSNAIKYTPEGGEIHVAVRRCPEGVLFQVKDSGIGVPKRAQARLFEKFYRAENAVALETEGTGLGLHLVRLIVEQFGGRVWCESEPGQGATFGFQLPAAGGS